VSWVVADQLLRRFAPSSDALPGSALNVFASERARRLACFVAADLPSNRRVEG
jgi:hypothetical protein